jgi:hypothetical protein
MSQTLHFTCTLLSKVVLSARAATEGQVDSLDYLPGAKFMGIVAKGYTDFDDGARHDLFHNGKVRFSNAYPCAKGRHFYPAPMVYFTKKGSKVTDGNVYLDHLLSPEVRKENSETGVQLKQVRKGFVDAAGKHYLTVETDYQLKSAYDADARRSKDSQMYGYFSIPQGAVFAFSVEDTTGKHGDAIRKALVGEHGVGRSRTAEYGRVRIDVAEAPKQPTTQASTTRDVLVYAASDLCFHDEFGQSKLPTAQDLGFTNGAKIDWARTQVRSGEYQSWNTKRWNRNADRWVIKKGSVFYLQEVSTDATKQRNWVGSCQQEGFGQIWSNPPFLQATHGSDQRPILGKVENYLTITTPTDTAPASTNLGLIELLNRRAKQRNNESHIYQQVNTFIDLHKSKFGAISPSQWGTLRSYAGHAANSEALDQLIFSIKTGFLHRGQSEKRWRNVRDELQVAVKQFDADDRALFLQKLAAEMAKRTKNQTA